MPFWLDLSRRNAACQFSGLLAKDVCEELEKCHGEIFQALAKSSLHHEKKRVMLLAKMFVDTHVAAIRADIG